MAKVDPIHEIASETAYILLGIVYVPHYTERGTYVGPGNVYYPVSYLELFRAEKIRLPLWPRQYST